MLSANGTSLNGTLNGTIHTPYPAWLPEGFQVSSQGASCPSAYRALTSFALYNCIAIAAFLLLGNQHVRSFLTKGRKASWEPWSLRASVASLALQVGGIVATAYLIRASGYQASVWQLIQLWALRPRVSWFIGNLVNLKQKWGYANGALSHIFVEVFVCALACVFLGRILQAALRSMPAHGPWQWWMILIAGVVMLISTGFEMVWALWMLKKIAEISGMPDAQDVHSLRWIPRLCVPVTATCSWLIWVAFLRAAEGYYCAGDIKLVQIVWIIVPVLANIVMVIIQ